MSSQNVYYKPQFQLACGNGRRPHRLKPVDCKFIARLAKAVPVIPVLAKADSMTTKELDYFRKSVRETLTKVLLFLSPMTAMFA